MMKEQTVCPETPAVKNDWSNSEQASHYHLLGDRPCISLSLRACFWLIAFSVAHLGKPQCVYAVITIRNHRPGGAVSGNGALQSAKPIISLVC